MQYRDAAGIGFAEKDEFQPFRSQDLFLIGEVRGHLLDDGLEIPHSVMIPQLEKQTVFPGRFLESDLAVLTEAAGDVFDLKAAFRPDPGNEGLACRDAFASLAAEQRLGGFVG